MVGKDYVQLDFATLLDLQRRDVVLLEKTQRPTTDQQQYASSNTTPARRFVENV